MADNPEEQKPKNEEKKEEKTTLESVVKESSEAVKGFTNSAIGTAAIGASTALFGLDGLVTAASFPIGGLIESKLSGKEFKSKHFRDEAIAGALFTPSLWYGLNTIKQVPKAFGLDGIVTNILGASVPISPLVVSGLFIGLTPALTALYYPLQYVIQNKTFKGIGKDFKEHYTKGLIRTLPLTALTSAAVGATYALPYLAPYLFPAIAVSNVLYRLLLSKEKLNYAKLLNPFTYVPNFLNPFYLANSVVNTTGKVYRDVITAASDLGASVRNILSKTPVTQAQINPA